MSFMELFSRYVAYPTWNFKERSQKLAEYRRLSRNQWDSREELKKRQLKRLQLIMAHAYMTVPFYRSRWVRNPIEFPLRSIDDLRDYPILTKQEVRRYRNDLISESFRKSELVQAKTGGSTGVALELYFDKRCQEFRNAAAMMADVWAGWRPGMLVAGLWGTPTVPRSFKEKVRNALHDRIFYLDTMDLNSESIDTFINAIRLKRPGALFGHAHSIYILASHIKRNKIAAPRFNAIVATSMMLMPSQRAVMEDVFNLPVTDRYGCEEVGLIACECEVHDGLHINAEHLVVESVHDNGIQCSEGEEGCLVLTDLNNFGMPLIRYMVGDVGTLSLKPCKCGRGLPMLSKLLGRSADYLKKGDGGLVSGISLVEKTLTAINGIEQLQIRQKSATHLVLNVVTDESVDSDQLRIESELKEIMKFVFGNDAEIEVRYCQDLQKSGNGKYRFAISEC